VRRGDRSGSESREVGIPRLPVLTDVENGLCLAGKQSSIQ
jgi:hypothetical protein